MKTASQYNPPIGVASPLFLCNHEVMKIINYIIFFWLAALPSLAFAQNLGFIHDLQEVSRDLGLYSGKVDGEISIDVVVSAYKLCQKHKEHCEDSARVILYYYAEQAHKIRYASVTNVEFLKRIRPAIENSPVFSKIGKAPLSYYSAVMRGSIFSNVVFAGEEYFLVYNNPVSDVVTAIKFERGIPKSIQIIAAEEVYGANLSSSTPAWLALQEPSISQILKSLSEVRDNINSDNKSFLKKIDADSSERIVKILKERVINTAYSSSNSKIDCVVKADEIAATKGGLYDRYKTIRSVESADEYSKISRYLPSHGFDMGAENYIRVYSDLFNPEKMAIVSIDLKNCRIKAIGFPIVAP